MLSSLHVIKKDNINFMSSVDLAKICVGDTKDAHSDFMKKAKKVLGGGVGNFSDTYIHPQNGQRYPSLLLPERESCLMAMSYSYELQAHVFDEWQRIKNEIQQPALPATYKDALIALVAEVEAKEAAEKRALIAEKTKSQISDKKTATAMATASVLSKKVKALESKLEDVGNYQSLKAAKLPERVETEINSNAQTWRVLMSISKSMNLPPKKVEDSNYGTVNTYHVDVINRFIEEYL